MFAADKPLPKKFYLIGLVVIFLAVYSQYFVKLGQVFGFLVVYGIPIVVASLFFGRQLLSRAAKNNKRATKLGLGMFGALTVIGIFISVVALYIILAFYPQATDLLQKPNPVLEVPASVAWVMIVVSFLVVGPAEEYIFRGFMYGGLLSIFKGKHWLPLAIVSSFMFAGVHAYYAVTYEVASVLPFISLITFSIAMSITFYKTGGNLLLPALVHGAYDATGFLGVATNMNYGLIARGILILVGVVFAIIIFVQKILWRPKLPSAPVEAPPPPLVSNVFEGEIVCSHCGAANSVGSQFCFKCGTPLQGKPA